MTPENIERTIDFILQHQANAEVRQEKTQGQIGELVVQNKETSTQIATLSRAMDARDQRVSATIETTSQEVKRVSQEVERVSREVEKVSQEVRVLSEDIQALKEVSRDLLDHGHHTDVRLDRIENPEL